MNKKITECNCQIQKYNEETKLVLFGWMIEILGDKDNPIENQRINSLLWAKLYNKLAQKSMECFEKLKEVKNNDTN